ncbi:acyl-CoA carboxylase subunit epsilon [Streptomyces sp. NPDC058818]|uniref:acyl-CoA carboxylase subunit epsilon n=1 Tax=Streptomyces sp. NPDC058818 TaxID=3346640 RepID=UPI003680BB8C
MTGSGIRVERGRPGPEELAAVTVVLMARAQATPARRDAREGIKALWHRLDGVRQFRAPHSWQS